MTKGKLEEATQLLCYAAGVNKKTIPLSLLSKVRGLRPGVGRASSLRILPGGTLAQRACPTHCLRKMVTSKLNPARGKTEARLALWEAGGPCGSCAGRKQAGVSAWPLAGPAYPVPAATRKEGG